MCDGWRRDGLRAHLKVLFRQKHSVYKYVEENALGVYFGARCWASYDNVSEVSCGVIGCCFVGVWGIEFVE